MLDQLLIARTLRVPVPAGPAGDGGALARQLDAALLSVGFKASGDLIAHLSGLDPDAGLDVAVSVIAAARRLVGDHVEHNVYFRDFPANVPDTLEFWAGLLSNALVDAGGTAVTLPPLLLGGINLLELPGYGTYQHTYAEMLAAHERFIPALGDRVTVLHLGAGLDEEYRRLYYELAGSRTPLSEADRELLELLAAACADDEAPGEIPVCENRALINRVRVAHGRDLIVDTVTDVLRVAVALSGGDVTLQRPARLRSLARRDRRTLLAALDAVAAAPGKLGDVQVRAEAFKRLGERLHPHEYAHTYPNAALVFAVARGEAAAPSLASRVEAKYAAGDTAGAVRLLASAPGMLIRQVDRAAARLDAAGLDVLCDAVAAGAPKASGRVLLSLREHLTNRHEPQRPGTKRIFANRAGRAFVVDETRAPLPRATVAALATVLDAEITNRLPRIDHLVVDPAILRAAIPLSGNAVPAGHAVFPRGSRTTVEPGLVRFFVHWQQSAQTTDYDLSVLLLDADFGFLDQVSYTNLTAPGIRHSGDVTRAPGPDGASEFIELDLARLAPSVAFAIPQVNVYSGEGFDEAAEAFVGYMHLQPGQAGKPFEARTVRMKAALTGTSRIALPMALERRENGTWDALWMNLSGHGLEHGNRVEANRLSTALLARAVAGRRYLHLGYLVEALRSRALLYTEWSEDTVLDEPVTFIGLQRPEKLPEGSEAYGMDRWNLLVPA